MAKSPWFREHRKQGERSTHAGEHVPVMLTECVAALNPQPGHVVVDCTLGFAGHSCELLKAVGPTGMLIAFDLDPEHITRAEEKLSAVGHPYHIHHGNFAGLSGVLAEKGITQINGLLADLGMSSMQVDDPDRGFSFLRDGPLDMRMDRTRGRTAAELLMTLSVEDLAAAFRDLGDQPEAETIAEAIVNERTHTPFERTKQLFDLVERVAPVQVIKSPGAGPARKQELRPATRVFQALRILVNRELANLQQLLRELPYVLAPGGTAAILAFHSGEDRLVKAAFREGFQNGSYSKVSDDPERPSEKEKAANPRSRSAKLRVATRSTV
ncbi:16S rRNA (cytosine(1402)-N(4))-methyltransferase RsmH [soil metagenome]